MTGEIKIGFDFSKSGLKSIFLMYGTPKMKPVSGLKSAIYGSKTQKEIAEIQEKVLSNHINKVMEGWDYGRFTYKYTGNFRLSS